MKKISSSLGFLLAAVFVVGSADHAVAEFRLSADERPIVVRTAMPNASARSIAVGLPGGQSYCFDAAESRFSYAWEAEEAFVDVRALWTGRGGRPVNPVGNRYYTAPSEYPLRLGDRDRVPGQVRFSGYRLIEGIPEFRYQIDGVGVREKIVAHPQGNGLIRLFEIDSSNEDIWFFAGEAAEPGIIISSPDGEFHDGMMRIPGGEMVRFQVNLTRASPE